MNDHVASKSKVKFLAWPYGIGYGIGLALVLGVVMYIVFRLSAMQGWQNDLTLLQARVEELEKLTRIMNESHSSRLDYLERTVYGDLLSKVMQPAPASPPVARFETWQLNREKELRARLDRLERWRLEHTREEQ